MRSSEGCLSLCFKESGAFGNYKITRNGDLFRKMLFGGPIGTIVEKELRKLNLAHSVLNYIQK